jgi:hypothetical protein
MKIFVIEMEVLMTLWGFNTSDKKWRFLFHVTSLAIMSFLLTVGFFDVSIVEARGPLLAEHTAAQWGGPETRTRCISEKSMTGFECHGLKCSRRTWKTCGEWATDFKQHRLLAKMYGPDNISNADSQLKDISEACLVSGLILAGAPAVVASIVDLDVEVLQKGVEACLKTQNLLSQIVAPGFEVTIEPSESW